MVSSTANGGSTGLRHSLRRGPRRSPIARRRTASVLGFNLAAIPHWDSTGLSPLIKVASNARIPPSGFIDACGRLRLRGNNCLPMFVRMHARQFAGQRGLEGSIELNLEIG